MRGKSERDSYKKGVREEIDRARERGRMHKHYRVRDRGGMSTKENIERKREREGVEAFISQAKKSNINKAGTHCS